jgi:hypothetical protein
MVGKRGTRSDQSKESSYLRKDVEDRPPQDRKYRFRDNSKLDPDDQRRVEFKTKLLDGVEHSKLEEYRKSDSDARFSKSN